MGNNSTKILFVCLGNICRSPMAEGIFTHLVNSKELQRNYFIDSAGTSAHHIGEKADSRMCRTALSKGIELTSRSRKVIASDFDDFDFIIAMDESNYSDLLALALKNGKPTARLSYMREYDTSQTDMNVPDPYYGGDNGFEEVFNILSVSCMNLLLYLEKQK